MHQLLKSNIFLDIQIEKSPNIQYMQIPVKELIEDYPSSLPSVLPFCPLLHFLFKWGVCMCMRLEC